MFEDTDATEQEMLAAGISPRTITALHLLNHRKTIATYEEYVRRIAMSGNAIAIDVKIADLTHNMSRQPSAKKKLLYPWALSVLTGKAA